MRFFEFNQNNSGGRFRFDEKAGITHWVIIEAENSQDANRRAEAIGLYFDGFGDCPCCGDRWSEQWEDEEGTETPTIYGEDAKAYVAMFRWMGENPEIVIHYADGRMEWISGDKPNDVSVEV